jgi:hypothetical protein
MLTSSLNSISKELYNACDILKINIENIDKKEIEAATTKDACENFKKTKESKIYLKPIFLDSNEDDHISFILSKSQTLPPGPIFEYIKFNKINKKYYFDIKFFNEESIEWPIYEIRLNKIMIEKGDDYSNLIPIINYKKHPTGIF